MQETQETWIQPQGCKGPLEKKMATHSNILAWEIPRTEKPGGLQSGGVSKESDTTERLRRHMYIIYELTDQLTVRPPWKQDESRTGICI